MPPDPVIHVGPVTPDRVAAAAALQVAAGQDLFVGDTAFNVADACRAPDSDAMAILCEDAVIGFYRLDHVASVVTRQPLGSGSVGLRAFMIDVRWQGRGYAARALAACCGDLARRRPDAALLALNVECRNIRAIRTYRNAGFVDTGELVAGGRGGPQHLMLRTLHPPRV